MATYELIPSGGPTPIKAWVQGVPLEQRARQQLLNVAQLPIIHKWVAAMPDVHWGMGATVGSVIPTLGAIIPAAVGVDIGCGMMAARTSLVAADLPDTLRDLRTVIEKAVPHGRSNRGKVGNWGRVPARAAHAWAALSPDYARIIDAHPSLDRGHHVTQLGTLGSGNHFVELCIDEAERVWLMLHSGSRGVGNRIGMHFIKLARADMKLHVADLPDTALAYFHEGAQHFEDYLFAVGWAQRYARVNREIMMANTLEALGRCALLPEFTVGEQAVNCHHNYVQRETHYGEEVYLTRKGAVSARAGELGIIPGSMGTRSYIVRGKGNPESFCSCSHGAGRAMSRTEAKRRFTLEDHERATAHVECRKDERVIDETPMAYKDIDAVMAAQRELVEIEHTLGQVICVKG